MSFPGSLHRYLVLRTATILVLVILSLPSLTILSIHGQSYNLNYDLGYSGTSFPGGIISVASDFTNTGQLTIRVTGISFASDFFSNGTRQVTSGVPFNLTTGSNKMINTAVLILVSAAIGSHNIVATATYEYSNSSGWYTASPIVASLAVMVSQTIDSLFSSNATILLIIGLGIVGVVVVLTAFLVVRRRKKQKSSARLPMGPPSNLRIPTGGSSFAGS